MKYKISIEDDIEVIADMLKVNDYKRALNDIKISIISIFAETEDHEDMYRELENFVDVEMCEILNGLDLD